MSIYDQDTDPSSPEARRPTPEPPGTMQTPAPPRRSSRAARTDPGMGPPSAPPTLQAAGRPMGVVVPPASKRGAAAVVASAPTGGRPKDSVELLLDGMAGPRPDRTKTLSQTSGEASAAYHAEHAVRAGRTARDEDRKVLVDTVRLPIGADADDLGGPMPGRDPTFVLPARLAPRVVIAVLAGLLVVVVLFAAFDHPSALFARGSTDDPAPEPAVATVPQPSIVTAPPAAQPQAAMPAEPLLPSVEAPAMTDPAAPPAAMATRPRTSGLRPKAGATDVGEFKTSF